MPTVENRLVKDSAKEAVLNKDDEHSDENKEPSNHKPNTGTIQVDYEKSDYDEVYF